MIYDLDWDMHSSVTSRKEIELRLLLLSASSWLANWCLRTDSIFGSGISIRAQAPRLHKRMHCWKPRPSSPLPYTASLLLPHGSLRLQYPLVPLHAASYHARRCTNGLGMSIVCEIVLVPLDDDPTEQGAL